MVQSRLTIRKKLAALLVATVGGTLVALVAIKCQLLEQLENSTWDARLHYIAGQIPPDPRIKIIMIDQSSLDHFARDEKVFWPWPRQIYVPVIKFLEAAHARAVAFDILFTEPSSYGVDDDQAFAEAMKSSVKVVTASALRNATLRERTDDIARFRSKVEGSEGFSATRDTIQSLPNVPSFVSATVPIQEYMSASAAIGNVSLAPDSDGIFRHTSPGGYIHDIPVLSLPFSLYSVSGLEKLSPDAFTHLIDERGRLTLRFSGPAKTFKTDPIAAIIRSYTEIDAGEKPLINPEEYKDAIVFVGMDAPGLLDLRPIPLSEIYPGVEYNATVLDNLIQKKFIQKASVEMNLLAAFVLIAIAAAATLFLTGVIPHLLALSAIGGIFISICFYVASAGVWLLMAIPLAVASFAVLTCLGYQYQLEGRQHRFLRHAFKHYVSPTVIDRIVDDPTSLALGGERRELTMFFSDIEGFTSISESIDAGKLVTLLNRFLSEMAKIILQTGGTVDKYVGDAIVAFWNAPIAVPDHAARAVQASIQCQERLLALRETFERDFGRPLKMRIGLHTGTVSVGNFGSTDRFNYTIIGDAANLASRLEGANKYFGTYILVSEETAQKLPREIEIRKIADIVVVGRKTATSVYEPLLGEMTAQRKEDLQTYLQAMKLFECGELEKAKDVFLSLPKDVVARRYISRIERDVQRKSAHEPWSPVWSLTEK